MPAQKHPHEPAGPGPLGEGTPLAFVPPEETRQEREQERRKGAPPALVGGTARRPGLWERWFGLGGRAASSPVGRGAVVAARVRRMDSARGGLAAVLARLLSTPLGAAGLTSAILGGAVVVGHYGLGAGGGREDADSSVFPVYDSPSAGGPAQTRAGRGADSLDFLRAANAKQEEAAGREKAAAEAAQAAPQAGEQAPPPAGEGVAAGEGVGAGQGAVGPGGDGAGRDKEGRLLASAFGASRGMAGGGGLSGGSGLSGGFNRPFDQPNAAAKQLAALKHGLKARTVQTRQMTPARRTGAMSQLRFTSGQSRRAAAAGSAETQAFQATTAFENAPPQAGGAAIPGAGPGAGGGTDLGTLGAGDGGPIDEIGTPLEEVPEVGPAKDKTRYNKLVAVAVALLMTASTIIIIEGILASFGILQPIAQMLAGIAAAMAASAAVMGAMIASGHGQQQQGMILTVGGSITTAASIAALAGPVSVAPIAAVLGGTVGLVTSIMAAVMKNRL